MNLSTIGHASPYFPKSTLAIKPICALAPDVEFSDAAQQWMASRSVKDVSGQQRGCYIRDTTKRSYWDLSPQPRHILYRIQTW
jgi:hypothetical protein